jgi:acetyltransferase-like isoleucine patch superfamily enzyme
VKFSRGGVGTGARTAATVAYAVVNAASRARRAVKGAALVSGFGRHGDNFVFDPDGVYSFPTILVGDDVDLGYRPILVATRSRIEIGNDVIFGPEVTIRGGNHRFDLPGIPMASVTDAMKDPEHDLGVRIGNDVWIGARVILRCVTTGDGSVVGAGSVVTIDPAVQHRRREPGAGDPPAVYRPAPRTAGRCPVTGASA